MNKIFFLLLCFFISPLIQAKDFGFRYKNGKCVDQNGKSGLNTGYLGQCTDFRGAIFGNIKLDGMDFSGSNFEGADLRGVSFVGTTFVGTNLKFVQLEGADLSKANFTEVNLTGVDFSKLKAEGAVFKNAMLNEVTFKSSQLKDADFSGASLENANFRKTDLKGAKTNQANLKNATFDKETVLPFSKDHALQVGMLLKNVGIVLIVWDIQDENFNAMVEALKAAGAEVDISPVIESEFRGGDLSKYSAIFHFDGRIGNCGEQDVPESGQDAFVDFVNKGGTFIHTEWSTCRFTVAKELQKMREILLFDRTTESSGSIPFVKIAGSENHPLLQGIQNFTADGNYNIGSIHQFSNNPVSVLMTGNGQPMVATRKYGNGRIVGFGFTCNESYQCMKNVGIQRLLINAVNEDW